MNSVCPSNLCFQISCRGADTYLGRYGKFCEPQYSGGIYLHACTVCFVIVLPSSNRVTTPFTRRCIGSSPCHIVRWWPSLSRISAGIQGESAG
ncbi:hypothetical protein F4W66_24345 (plasmid) [Escherichia coli]|nr:hypothetical protein F4W66_24345 [Escherichia coli]